jgi:hypothetical protein
MQWPVLRAAIDRLLRSTEREVSLGFVGGEPCLRFPLIRRAVLYAKKSCPRNRKIGFDLVTNGTLLRSPEVAFLAAHDVDLQLSFDGVRPAQDLRGKGTFRRLNGLLERCGSSNRASSGTAFVSRSLSRSQDPHLADSVSISRKAMPDIAVSPSWDRDRLGT